MDMGKLPVRENWGSWSTLGAQDESAQAYLTEGSYGVTGADRIWFVVHDAGPAWVTLEDGHRRGLPAGAFGGGPYGTHLTYADPESAMDAAEMLAEQEQED